MNFSDWLRQQKDRPDPVGHLSDDTFHDPCCIPFSKTPSMLKRHMIEKHEAAYEALEALDQAAKEWRSLESVAH